MKKEPILPTHVQTLALQPNAIVQITNDKHHWFPALVIVSELKNFGIQGYCTMPTKGNAYIRLNYEDFDLVGMAAVVVDEGE